MASCFFLQSTEQTVKEKDTTKVSRTITMDNQFSGSQVTQNNNKEETLRRRRERFGEASPTKLIPSKQVFIVPPSNTINILKKRKERFGESVSSLLKEIEGKEKMLKRQARFCANTPIQPQAKQVKLKPLENRTISPDLHVFQTIDQIDEKERKKRDWQY